MESSEDHIVKGVDCRFPIFGNLRIACDGSIPEHVPRILRATAGIIHLAMASKTNSVVFLPGVTGLLPLMASLAILPALRECAIAGGTEIVFTKGQRVRDPSGSIMEYSHETWDERGHYIWFICGDDSTRGLPANIAHILQPTTTSRRLSSSIHQIDSTNPNCTLDTILGTTTRGNRSSFDRTVVMVGSVVRSTEFISNAIVGSGRLLDLFQWGKLDYHGQCEVITPGQIDAIPICVLSADMARTDEYLHSNADQVFGVLVEGTTPCLKDMASLDEVQDLGTPVCVLADIADVDSVTELERRGFHPWSWNCTTLRLVHEEPARGRIFGAFMRAAETFGRLETRVLDCHHEKLRQTAETISAIQRATQLDSDEWNDIFRSLFGLLNGLSRLVRSPSTEWIESASEQEILLSSRLSHIRALVDATTYERLGHAIQDLHQIRSDFQHAPNPKIRVLSEAIDNGKIPQPSVVVFCSPAEAAGTAQFWRDRLDSNELYFISLPDLLATQTPARYRSVILPAWFGKSAVSRILGTLIAPDAVFLLYEHEASWYQHAVPRLLRQVRTDAAHFSKLLLLDCENLEQDSVQIVQTKGVSDGWSTMSFQDLALRDRAKERIGTLRSKALDSEQTVKAKFVIFGSGKLAAITEYHTLIVVRGFVGATAYIEDLHVDDLRIGDYILFHSSSRDLLREVADRILAESNLSNLRDLSRTWKECLLLKLIALDFDEEKLLSYLNMGGIHRHPATVRTWLHDQNLIGPQSRKDLARIIDTCCEQKVPHDTASVWSAIRIVRSAHLRARGKIDDLIRMALQEQLGQVDVPSQTFTIDLDEMGEGTLLQTIEVSEAWDDVDQSQANRLI